MNTAKKSFGVRNIYCLPFLPHLACKVDLLHDLLVTRAQCELIRCNAVIIRFFNVDCEIIALSLRRQKLRNKIARNKIASKLVRE